jgi:hypothetical protein
LDFRLCEDEGTFDDTARAFAAVARALHAERRDPAEALPAATSRRAAARDGGSERRLRDRRVHRTLDGADELVRLVIARPALERGSRV